MSSATIAHRPLPPPSTPGFSLPRSVAMAAATSLHLALAALLAVPIAAPEPPPAAPEPVAVLLTPALPPPRIAPPPPVLRPVIRVTPAAPRPLPSVPPPLTPINPGAAPAVDTPRPLDLPSAPADVGAGDAGAGPEATSLQLRSGTAPRYPAAALSRRLQGEVELLVLVGIDGRPESVSVARSSGHAVLDRAARDHVLRRWVFVPSVRDGLPVPAYARVPVRFSLP